jgi:hypothetical protein
MLPDPGAISRSTAPASKPSVLLGPEVGTSTVQFTMLGRLIDAH